MRLPWAGPLLRASPLVALLAGLPLFFHTGFSLTGSAFFGAVSNLGHSAYFALLTLAGLYYGRHPLDRWLSKRWQYWLLFSALTLVVGLSIELIQHQVGRQFDWHDVGYNLFGAWLALAIWPTTRPPLNRYGVLIPCTLGLILMMELFQATQGFYDRRHLEQQLPLVFDQTQPRTLNHWEGPVDWSHEYPDDGAATAEPTLPLLRIALSTEQYSGPFLQRMPNNWHKYDALSFRLYNPDTTAFALTLRINDHQHELGEQAYEDRFNQGLIVQPGWNHFQIPMPQIANAPQGRQMNLEEIRRLGLFATNLTEPRQVYLDDLRLLAHDN